MMRAVQAHTSSRNNKTSRNGRNQSLPLCPCSAASICPSAAWAEPLLLSCLMYRQVQYHQAPLVTPLRKAKSLSVSAVHDCSQLLSVQPLHDCCCCGPLNPLLALVWLGLSPGMTVSWASCMCCCFAAHWKLRWCLQAYSSCVWGPLLPCCAAACWAAAASPSGPSLLRSAHCLPLQQRLQRQQ
jgi:hypothetical protein